MVVSHLGLRRFCLRQVSDQQHRIQPPIKGPAGRLLRTDVAQTQRQMQPDRSRVGAIPDHGNHLWRADNFAAAHEFSHQQSGSATTFLLRMNANGIFDAEPVSRSRAKPVGIGIARHLSLDFRPLDKTSAHRWPFLEVWGLAVQNCRSRRSPSACKSPEWPEGSTNGATQQHGYASRVNKPKVYSQRAMSVCAQSI